MTCWLGSMNIYSKYIILLIVLAGLGFSGYLGQRFHEKESAAIATEFRKDVDDKASALEREILLNIEVLYAFRGLFDSSEHVTAKEFARIAQSFIVRHQDIYAIEWAPRITHQQREPFELTQQRLFTDFEITQKLASGMLVAEQQRSEYFPIAYVEPVAGNEFALGYNLASNSTRMAALAVSRDLDLVVASASTPLLGQGRQQYGTLVSIPVYQGLPKNVIKRREQIKGFVLLVLKVSDMFDRAVQRTAAKGIYFTLEDRTLGSEIEVLYSNQTIPMQFSVAQNDFSYTKPLASVGRRSWSINAIPSLGYIAERRSMMPYLITAIGWVFVLLGSAYVYALLRRTTLIEEEVAQRTQALEEAKLKLEQLSQTDALTKIANRRFFDEAFNHEWLRAVRQGSSLGLMMIDIDHFKLYNDTYGHQAGDECLAAVAQAIEQTLNRKADVVARYGGEEFVVLLPDTKDCVVPAQRCLANIEALAIPHRASPTSNYITVSIGVSIALPKQDSRSEAFIHQTDIALYEAKRSGRNRVEIADGALLSL